MIKNLIIPILLLMAFSSNAQLNNNWIDYNKVYYKFKVAEDRMVRIPQSTIAAIGLSATPAKSFQLWRNGKQVRLFVSTVNPNAALGVDDFIEFWGQMNDGIPDNQLYRNSDFQLADKYSLENDTSSYFLTVNSSSANLRYTNTNNLAPSTRTPDAYFMRSIDYYYKNQINRGEAKPIGEYVYSSSYDQAEGWSSNPVEPCCSLSHNFYGLNLYTDDPSANLTVRINMAGSAANDRTVSIKLFDNEITDNTYASPIRMRNFDYKKSVIQNLPLSFFQNTTDLPVTIINNSTNSFDRVVVSSLGITYPAAFNFNYEENFYFTLLPSATGNYLEIDNFNFGSTPPVLYDETLGNTSANRYLGEILSTPGKVKFLLPPSTSERKFRLMNQENVNIISEEAITRRTFLKINQAANQGKYLIVSNANLFDDGNGNNYVDLYRQYRSSSAGGSHAAKVYDIDELTDQFGFGIKNHPGAIRDFVRYACSSFTAKPTYLFIIGRGLTYIDQINNQSNPLAEKLNLVPTFGWPASDNLLASLPGLSKPLIPVGRLGAVTPTEISNYLNKVVEYENAQRFTNGSVDMGWMKNFMHVVGGKDSSENNEFRNYMNSYKIIAEDTSLGAHVETFTKTSTAAIQQASGNRITQLFNNGLAFVDYFGHSSANTFEFNLSNPEIYNNQGKYPFFNVSGCSAGNFYVFDQLRLNGNLTLSEKYVLANSRGSIGFLADTHFGIPPFLNIFNTELYKAISKKMYGYSIGSQIDSVMEILGGSNPSLDFFTRIHLEEINLHGDPAIKINNFAKPDFVVEDRLVKISPNVISVADSSFNLKIQMLNIGRAVGDSIYVNVKRQLSNDSIITLFDELIPSIKYADSLSFNLSINPLTDKGLNKIIVTIDKTGRINELSELNNSVTKEFYIFENAIRPVYPQNYSIVNRQNISYFASTANPMNGDNEYVIEVDTTILFNSSLKRTSSKFGVGGMIEFTSDDISLTFLENTVYYWRVAIVPEIDSPYIWNSSSFIYLEGSSPGYNQSHYYQKLQSPINNISLNQDRTYQFAREPRNLTIRTGLFPYFNFDQINVNLDFNQLEYYGCVDFGNPNGYNNIQFYVFDTATLLPWRNQNVSDVNGLYGSLHVCQNDATPYDSSRAFFEFNYSDPDQRRSAMDFIDIIPDGMYVAITNLGRTSNTTFVDQWKEDTAILGSGNSLYHKLVSLGFDQIGNFDRNLPFLYFFKKGSTDFPSTQIVGPEDSSYIDRTFVLDAIKSDGSIESPAFGPAVSWTSLHWNGNSVDADTTLDTVRVNVWGVQSNGTSDFLTVIDPSRDTSLDFVDATIYPYVRLEMTNKDNINLTPYQLDYFRINAVPRPEGAIAPSLQFSFKDNLEQGEPLNFSVAFKNVSETDFEKTMKVKMILTDQENIAHPVDIPERKIIASGDTMVVDYQIDTRTLVGNNNLFIEFNPDNDQTEQLHYNNILYKDFFVNKDRYNPLLDVTFDGVHILNRDLVAAKPHIQIKLKDENRYMSLNDTSFVKIQLRFPDQSLQDYSYGNQMFFTPADLTSGNNVAGVDFYPQLSQDGEYELIVTGRDSVGNPAGSSEYRVTFTVINKPMISNLLNYPNPFTSSTAFVFTVTGSEVPQNIRIQIMTITGKVVREITKNELGPIHIGRNITDYKWDGTDMYGQKLANGVYIYRVLTNLNGKKLDKFNSEDELTDQYFNKGYGKMYLMR